MGFEDLGGAPLPLPLLLLMLPLPLLLPPRPWQAREEYERRARRVHKVVLATLALLQVRSGRCLVRLL